ncbi:type II toxin-antitoxin system RelE/ParE family toxin [Rhizobium sp.]|jgi:plasmid stabilization system protein ParE|uniref:type II toxin-antitoxin system RelE/ParE family toxin n=1 Tax=Rhizobium sp. TaxID=391 RepID=UPI000DB96DD0
MMKVILSKDAADYLSHEYGYLSAFNSRAADAAMARIQGGIRRLAAYPQVGAPVPMLTGRRQLVVGPYIITYRIGRDAIMVSDITHGRQREQLDKDDGLDESD